ncbi:PqqD family protein [Streptomyces sp. FIT100]|uniref:PqqD family protein n=1 Tax=Streptomyces sp. FIT100 TaxID=2837956 RepID=UPI0021C6EB27|nr:PqqD family protein [Streptomyces sp. FIT100]UUN26972.1 PqqD family protein [Streptomyces sp. FIT100]
MSNQSPTYGRESDSTLHETLSSYLSAVELHGIASVGDKLIEAAGGVGQLADYKVMVAYGGGKDSSYVVAFVRAVQLHLQLAHGRTFVMRVANMRHAGVPTAVMENIDRVYRALELLDDPRCELITVDHTEIRRFCVDLPLPDRLRTINRVDVLMNGHRSAGDGRPTFCNSCNLAVADFYGRAAWWQGGVDAIMTGDSRREQLLYSAWILRLAKESGIDVEQCRSMGFRGLLTALRGIANTYFQELFGEDGIAELAEREVATGDRSLQPAFISIYDLVSYRVHDHWELIVDFLGFQFDDLAFSFTESDCANPTLMAHLRGLRTQYVEGRTYEAGIKEYLQLAEMMMHKKEMPERLIQLALSRYDTSEKITERRGMSAEYALDAFALQEDALVAMVFSPFTDEGARLARFVDDCHPKMAGRVADLHLALRGESDTEDVITWLKEVSALTIGQLRTLYRSSLVDFQTKESMIARVRVGDPHKAEIETVDPQTGSRTLELISGR